MNLSRFRVSFSLPKDQKELLKRLKRLGKKVKAFAVALVWKF